MKTPKTARQDKIAEEIRRALSPIFHFELKDPRIVGVSITDIKMTPDLHVARVYFTLPGGNDPKQVKEVSAGLKSSSGLLRRLVAERINLKYAPTFEFFYDESLELQGRIDELFRQIEKT